MKLSIFDIKHHCTPARVYLIISLIYVVIHLLVMMGYDTNATNGHGLPSFITERVGHNSLLYPVVGTLVNVVFVFLWAWILNMICKRFTTYGTTISWVLVIVPLVIQCIILIMGAVIVSNVVSDVLTNQVADDTVVI